MQFDQGRRELGGDPGQRFLGAPFQKMFSEKNFFGQQQLPPPPLPVDNFLGKKWEIFAGKYFTQK
jgi:hypothetical protein